MIGLWEEQSGNCNKSDVCVWEGVGGGMTATLQSSNQASIHVQHLILSSDPNHLPGFPVTFQFSGIAGQDAACQQG